MNTSNIEDTDGNSAGFSSTKIAFLVFGFVAIFLTSFALVSEFSILYPSDTTISHINKYNLEILQSQTKNGVESNISRIDLYLLLSRDMWQIWGTSLSGVFLSVLIYMFMVRQVGSFRLYSQLKQYKSLLNRERTGKKNAIAKAEDVQYQVLDMHEWISEAYIHINKNGRIKYINKNAKRLFKNWLGIENSESLNRVKFTDLVPDYEHSEIKVVIDEAVSKKSSSVASKEIKLTAKNSEVIWVNMRCYTSGEELSFYIQDITEEKKTYKNNSSKLDNIILQQISNNTPVAIAAMDMQWNYIFASKFWREAFSIKDLDIVGKNHKQYLPDFPGKWSVLEKSVRAGKRVSAKETLIQVKGKEEWVQWELAPLVDSQDEVKGSMLFVTFITDSKHNQEKLSHASEAERKLAYHDSLTGLPNRQLFYDRLNMSLAQAYRQLNKIGLFFLDLDGFKAINDTLGHEMGDLLLKEVASRLQKCIRDTDTLARLGGDEFTIILNGISDENDAAHIADKVVKSLATPFEIKGNEIKVSTSVGVAIYPNDASTPAELTKNADTAMYWAKEGGKNQYMFFDKNNNKVSDSELRQDISDEPEVISEEDAKMESDNNLKSQFKTALANSELSVIYRPRYDLSAKEMSGAEADISWSKSRLKDLSKIEFANAAEENGMILPIGEWLIKNGLEHIKNLKDEDSLDKYHDISLIIGMYGRQLKDKDLVSRVKDMIKSLKINPKRVVFKFSVYSLLQNDVNDSLLILRNFGARILVDGIDGEKESQKVIDKYKIDEVKLLPELIAEAQNDVASRDKLKELVESLKSKDIKITCDGVTSDTQLNMATNIGCDYAQGKFTDDISIPVKLRKIFNI